jgi:ferredoxin
MAKPQVNEELCIGCGTCEALCPQMFKVENGKSHVISEDCEKAGCDCNEAVTSCPVSAISIGN